MKGPTALVLALAMGASSILSIAKADAQQPPNPNTPSQAQPAQPQSNAPAPSASSQNGAPAPAQAAPTVQQQQPAPPQAAAPPLDAHGRYVVAVSIYRAATRAKDLLSVVQPDNWKMDDAARKSFDKTRQKAQDAVSAALESNDNLAHHPDDVGYSLKTRALVQTTLLLLNQLADAATLYDPNGWAKQLRSSSETLAASTQPLDADVPLPAPPGHALEPETEKVEVPTSYSAPPATLTNETGTLQPADVKQLLYRAYVAGFRFSDLLTVLDPAQLKLDDPGRRRLDALLDAVRGDLKDFESWRSQLEVQPDDVFLAYKTYAAMSTALAPMDELADDVARYQSPEAGMQFERAGQEFVGARKSLDGYLSFLLRNRQQVRAAIESDLAGCQKTLNYAMYGKTGGVTNMTNINPVFRGHLGHPRDGAKPGQPEEKTAAANKSAASAHAGGNGKAAPSKAQATPKGAKRGSAKRVSHSKHGSRQTTKKTGQT